MNTENAQDLAHIIDHTLLKADAAEREVAALCEEAVSFGFCSVCVPPVYVGIAKEHLSLSKVKIATVVGFPLGTAMTEVKIYEAVQAVIKGADELDIVMNVSAVKSGQWDAVRKELCDIVTATKGAVHKVIIEACYLDKEEKKKACDAVLFSGARFIKTSTGFGPAGASVEDVALIKSITGDSLMIKAAGGIRTLQDVRDLVSAGASRIGTSAGVSIMKELDR